MPDRLRAAVIEAIAATADRRGFMATRQANGFPQYADAAIAVIRNEIETVCAENPTDATEDYRLGLVLDMFREATMADLRTVIAKTTARFDGVEEPHHIDWELADAIIKALFVAGYDVSESIDVAEDA